MSSISNNLQSPEMCLRIDVSSLKGRFFNDTDIKGYAEEVNALALKILDHSVDHNKNIYSFILQDLQDVYDCLHVSRWSAGFLIALGSKEFKTITIGDTSKLIKQNRVCLGEVNSRLDRIYQIFKYEWNYSPQNLLSLLEKINESRDSEEFNDYDTRDFDLIDSINYNIDFGEARYFCNADQPYSLTLENVKEAIQHLQPPNTNSSSCSVPCFIQ